MGRHTAQRTHLPGAAAGGREGWQGRLEERVNDAAAVKVARYGSGHRRWPARVTIVCDVDFRTLLRAAADKRGMSAWGYARRAVAAFIAADLDLRFERVAEHTPWPTPPGGPMSLPAARHPRNNPGRWPDNGKGYGSWKVDVGKPGFEDKPSC